MIVARALSASARHRAASERQFATALEDAPTLVDVIVLEQSFAKHELVRWVVGVGAGRRSACCCEASW